MIERLTSATSADIECIGGKAAGLVRLLRTGLDVPEAWVIPAAVSLDPNREALLETMLTQWWRQASADFPESLWAVRSSAVAEDLDHASFAGVYETVLGVHTLEELLDAVRQCWRAVSLHRAQVYRSKSGADPHSGIAIVLQRMLQPRVAGVMLTADPLRPYDDHLVIDASYGLGESVVSGAADPDHYVLRRTTGEELRRRIGGKAVETVWNDGLQTLEVDGQRRETACLTADDLRKLHSAARCVERTIGIRRDLEWAIEDDRLYLLQDRPITGLPSLNPADVYSRRYGDEYLSEYYFPLPTDLMLYWIDETRAELDKLIDRRRPAIPSSRMYNGYAYMSANWLLRTVEAMPVSARATFLPWYPPNIQEQIMAAPLRRRLVLSMLRAPYADKGRGPLLKNPIALQQHCARVENAIRPKLDQDYPALSPEEIRRQFAEVDKLGMDHFRVIRWGMMLYNPALHSVLTKLLTRWCADEDGALYQAIISGLPDTATARINRELFALAATARANPDLRQALLAGADPRQIPDTAFFPAFEKFLARHGHRAATRNIAEPRWRETPEDLLAMIAAQLHLEVATDPTAAAQESVARRRTAEQTALRRVGAVRRPLLRKVMELTQQYTEYRENQRYYLDYLLAHLRNLVMECGRRFTEQGVLEYPQQVHYLDADQLWALLEGQPVPPDLAAQLKERHEHWLVYRDRMPATYLFDDVEVDETAVDHELDDADDTDCLRGVPASRGIARGRTRVVRDLAGLAAVEPGDILVAGNIDPGWTSVFPVLAGLITATGGTLSHGAILAREYGIPTVTNVKDAPTLLPSGTEVEVDGGRGTVVIREPVPTAAT